MRIAIIGPVNEIGFQVIKELVQHGHSLTMISPNAVKSVDNIEIINKTVFNLTKDDLMGFDVVIDAFSQNNPELTIQNVTSVAGLIHIMKKLPGVRFVMVGDAEFLYKDEKRQSFVKDNSQTNDIKKSRLNAFKMLAESGINWTCFAPALNFESSGERSENITFGTDYVINNKRGDSYISYSDYAAALADIIENKKGQSGVITAVSEGEEKVKEFKDMTSSFEGVSQYKAPSVLELAGRSVHLVMDDGPDGVLTFLSGDTVYWMPDEGPYRLDYYDCLKADEDTYMFTVEAVGISPRTGVTVVLDFEQSLVTVILAHTGTNPAFPLLVTNEIIFGAIKVPGKPLPRIRHGYSSDLAYSRLDWRCMAIEGHLTHVYGDTLYVRVPDPDPNDTSPMAEAFRERPYDERSHMIKIKEGLYLYSFLESNMTYNGVIGNNLAILCDIRKPHDIGRSFGTNHMGLPENYLYSGIATWKDEVGPEETRQSVYRV